MKYIVKYQSTPYIHSVAAVLKVDAQGRVEAWATAFDHLTTAGHAVDATDHGLQKSLTLKEDLAAARALGVPDIRGPVHILELVEYQPQHAGSVVNA